MSGCERFVGSRRTDGTILRVVELGTYFFGVGEPPLGHNHNEPPAPSLFLYCCFGREEIKRRNGKGIYG